MDGPESTFSPVQSNLQ